MRVFINGVPQPKRFGQVRLHESRGRLSGGSLRRSRFESSGDSDGLCYRFNSWEIFKGSIHSLVFSGDDMKSILTAMLEPLGLPSNLVSSVKFDIKQNKNGGETWDFKLAKGTRMVFHVDEGGEIDSGSLFEEGVRRPVQNMWIVDDNGGLSKDFFYWLEGEVSPLVRRSSRSESRRYFRR